MVSEEMTPNVEEMKSQKDIEGFSKALDFNNDSDIQIKSVQALAEIGDEKAVNVLIDALKNSSSSVRLAVAEKLGEIGDAQFVKPLLAALFNESDIYIRDLLEKVLKTYNNKVINSCIKSEFLDLPEISLDNLLKFLDTYKSIGYVSIRMASSICIKLGPSSIEAIIELMHFDIQKRLNSENSWRSDNIVWVLGEVGETAIPYLSAVLNKTSYAHEALGKIGTSEAVNILHSESKSFDRMRVEAAKKGLRIKREENIFLLLLDYAKDIWNDLISS